MSSENPANHQNTVRSGESVAVGQQQITIHVTAPELTSRPPGRTARILLSLSLLLNFWLLLGSGMSTSSAVPEAFLEGTQGAAARLAVISVSGMISPPFTERWIKQIRAAAKDDSVRGVILAIDSPGGFVADSHQLHHEIELLAAKHPGLTLAGNAYHGVGIPFCIRSGESAAKTLAGVASDQPSAASVTEIDVSRSGS